MEGGQLENRGGIGNKVWKDGRRRGDNKKIEEGEGYGKDGVK